MQNNPPETAATRTVRVLCLHGAGTNSEVFQAQTAALRYALGPSYEFHFVDAQHPSPGNVGINEIFGSDQIYFSWYGETSESALQALEDLADYASQNGPFQMVLAFSSGAAMAATLLIDQSFQKQKASFECAVFICSTVPWDLRELRAGREMDLDWRKAEEAIQIPTLHAWGSNDVQSGLESSDLVKVCRRDLRMEVVHNAGHGVPSHGKEFEQVLAAIGTMTKQE